MDRPHKQAGHMTAPTSSPKTCCSPLAKRGPSTHDTGLCIDDIVLASRTAFQLDDGLRHDRLLVPREKNPGVLAHFGDVAVDRRPAGRLGGDGGEMRLGT